MKENTPSLDSVLWPKGTFAPSSGLAETRTIAGRPGFVVLTGAHGYNYRDYYVSLGDSRTLVARFGVIGDYLQGIKPGPSEQKQIDAIEKVIASLRLLDP